MPSYKVQERKNRPEGGFLLDDRDYLLAVDAAVKAGLAALGEGHGAGNHGIKRMVFADLYVLACINLRAALADDNHARTSCLAIRKLHPEVFRV